MHNRNGIYEFYQVGRFRLDKFTYDRNDVIALVEYWQTDEFKDQSSLLNDHDFLPLKLRADELAAMAQILPPGDERDYIFAIHQAVEGLNLIHWNFDDLLEVGLLPNSPNSADDLMREGLQEHKAMVDKAMEKIVSFDPDPPVAKRAKGVQPAFKKQTTTPG